MTLAIICERCGTVLTVYRGDLLAMPQDLRLLEAIAYVHDSHRCSHDTEGDPTHDRRSAPAD